MNYAYRFVRLCLCVYFAATITSPAIAQVAGAQDSLADTIDQAILRETSGGFWGVALVARGDEVLFSQGYGLSDYHGIVNSADTRFEIASVTKQFTSAAVYTLHEQGKLDVHHALGVYFPSLESPYRELTIHQLITHTSGLPGEFVLPYNSSATRDELVESMSRYPLASDPGSEYLYCNGAYAILAAVVEEVTGTPFEDYVRSAIFKPAGLENAGFIGEPTPPGVHDAHRLAPDGTRSVGSHWYSGWGYKGMGGVMISANELLQWSRVLRTEEVLSEQTKQLMWSTTDANSTAASGWLIQNMNGQHVQLHGGSVEGFGAMFTRVPADDTTMVVLSNYSWMSSSIHEVIFELLYPPPSLSGVIDLRGLELNEFDAFIAEHGEFSMIPDDDDESGTLRIEFMTVNDGTPVLSRNPPKTTLTLEIPNDARSEIASQITEILEQPEFSDTVADGMELGLYGYPYDTSEIIPLNYLKVNVYPMYRGRDKEGNAIHDRRITLMIEDKGSRGLPVILKLGRTEAKEFVILLNKRNDEAVTE